MLKHGKVVESQQFQRQRTKPRNHSCTLHVITRWFFIFSLFLLILLSGVLIWQKCGDPVFFPIKHIKISGDLNHVNRDSLEKIILPFTNHGFLRLNSRRLKSKLLSEPWIEQVVIKRFWPDTVAVNFTTKIPVASIGNNDLLDSQGNVFSAGEVNVTMLDLPFFVGALSDQKYLLQSYQKMQSIIANLSLKIKLLKFVDQQYWFIRLNNGLALYLSRPEADVQLKRFVAVYPDVIESKASMIDYVDLRYAHGMAVKLKNHLLKNNPY